MTTTLLAFLIGISNVGAQNLPSQNSSQTQSTKSLPTAFFYLKPVVLNREQHKGLRFKPTNFDFASKSQAVPLVVQEFQSASDEYAIVFTKGTDGIWLALAVTGLQAEVNTFIDPKGLWLARYVPFSVRRYPFILAETGKDQFSLAADISASHWGTEGERIFDDQGVPTEFTRKLMPSLIDFQNQAKQTNTFIQKLDEAKLLTQKNLQVRLHNGRNGVIEGVWIVNEPQLRELPDDKVLAWFKGGELAAVYAHILSLRNLVPLLERSQAPATPSDTSLQRPALKAIPNPTGKPSNKTTNK
ncbi:SapC family protein [Limnohabitans sp. Hippo3]|uniref:SapC family protein n=1 Tax=Limnohabitans sp. Hippo3 TaxID=1597956 RepID=UPI0013048515|nr:SapC family protein [Limnohabitans sp. Hippo3]